MVTASWGAFGRGPSPRLSDRKIWVVSAGVGVIAGVVVPLTRPVPDDRGMLGGFLAPSANVPRPGRRATDGRPSRGLREGQLTIKAERSEMKEFDGRSKFSYGSFAVAAVPKNVVRAAK